MKLLLTSTGLRTAKIRRAFNDLIKKDVSKTRVIFITINTTSKRGSYYTNRELERITNAGIKKENIKLLDLSQGGIINIEPFDVIYVAGGNTYKYLKELRDAGLMDKIRRAVKNGRLYVGSSAGSILAGPEIRASQEENTVKLKDLACLRLVSFTVMPHYNHKRKRELEKLRKETVYEIKPLRDEEAIKIDYELIK
ncbi:hypothetical protein GF352_04870 [archaeon]|nr:hypothetical protein [archaeon]